MKIAFTTSGHDLSGPLESRFGRAPRFLIYDTERGAFDLVDNSQALESAQGAGVQAAETVVRSGATELVTGHCGPKAFRVLSTAGVRIYTTGAATIAEALAAHREGTLQPAHEADVQGHWA